MAGLIRQIAEVASTERARRVTGVSVWLGALCHFSREHFIEHFEQVSDGTVAEGARLNLTLSSDIEDANAQNVVLERVEVEV